jgi:hypothetical protein
MKDLKGSSNHRSLKRKRRQSNISDDGDVSPLEYQSFPFIRNKENGENEVFLLENFKR